jgi:hypothetical protein
MGFAHGQAIVQLPTVGNFSINTAVSVPDSGAAYLGSLRSAASAQASRGPGFVASGSQRAVGGASVKATIIDLDELDRMIRSQSNRNPMDGNLSGIPANPNTYPMTAKPQPAQKPEYAYLEALTHGSTSSMEKATEDAKYYLALARSARQKGHWHAVELYYRLAWESLPAERRQLAMRQLELAQTKVADEQAKKATKSR